MPKQAAERDAAEYAKSIKYEPKAGFHENESKPKPAAAAGGNRPPIDPPHDGPYNPYVMSGDDYHEHNDPKSYEQFKGMF